MGQNLDSEALSLSRQPPPHPAMDYARLRAEGIRHLERLAAEDWTDFNAHDPGITILEQFCYAITDLAYRIDHAVPDLLAEEGDDPYRSLFTPGPILTTDPVTLTDYRKLVLDVPGVKNAWIEPVETQALPLYYHEGKRTLSLEEGGEISEPVRLKGLYRVLIEKSDAADLDGAAVRREAIARLHAHRGLCTDFVSIDLLPPQPVAVDAEIEIGPVEDAAALLVRIYLQLADYISPAARFMSLKEALEGEIPVDVFFDGPWLLHGFLDSAALARMERKRALHASDILHRMMDVPGVRAVRKLRLSADGKGEAWSLALDADRAPRLDLPGSSIRLVKAGMAIRVDDRAVAEGYAAALKRKTPVRPPSSEKPDLVPPAGRSREVARYVSIQRQFPALYGIGEAGLPDSAPPQRKGEAKQLSAYLLFFDQLLANTFAQLSHLKDLFSFFSPSRRTYFSQPVSDPALKLDTLYTAPPGVHADRVQTITEEAAEDDADPWSRKNRFLSHLAARFAEQFTDYALMLYSLTPDGTPPGERLAADTAAFLRDYPRISRGRGSGGNLLSADGAAGRAGLEARLRLKLGLNDAAGERFYLVEHILLRPLEGDKGQHLPILSASVSRDPYSLQLSVVFPREAGRFAQPAFARFVEQTVREETPAHLVPYVHWLDEGPFADFETAYSAWAEKRRLIWSGTDGA